MEKQQLFRVRVLTRNPKTEAETCLDVGPAMPQEYAQQLCDAIVMKIREGKERTWSDPIIYPIYT